MTSIHDTSSGDKLARLQTPGGRYAMLALDQRESLRGMFANSPSGHSGTDADLREFKLASTRLLTPFASGVLLDRLYALDQDSLDSLDPECGLIVAVDELIQEPGQPVTSTLLDAEANASFLREVKADALKFLVMWRSDKERGEREALISTVLDLATEAGVASLIEAVVLPEEGNQWTDFSEKNDAILRAAQEMASYPMDLYKAQVPGYQPGDVSAVAAAARELDAMVPVPWVVLSNGVQIADFSDAVNQSCQGGASGFLAGRAIWSDVVGSVSLDDTLEGIARPRLESLAHLVNSLK